MSTNPFDLRQLIANEDDPKLRVLLMLVNTFNENLAANTIAVDANAAAVKDIAAKLDGHLVAFEERAAKDDALKNEGKGAWRVIVWVFGGFQAVGLASMMYLSGELKDIHASIVLSQRVEAVLASRITAIEAATRTNRP